MAFYNVFFTYETHHEAVDLINWFFTDLTIRLRIHRSETGKTEKLLGYKITKINV